MTNNSFKRGLSFILAILMLLGIFPFDALGLNGTSPVQAANTAPALEVGTVKNIKQSINNTDVNMLECKRTLEGELSLNWPQQENFVDVVIIQDFSGSFDSTIDEVGTAVRNITNSLNMGTDIDGKSPKDRVMFVGYRGSEGMANLNSSGVPTFNGGSPYGYTYDSNGSYEVEASNLFTDHVGIGNYISDHYTSGYTDGGTPTVDGMRLAQTEYPKKTPTSVTYNNTTYKVGEQPRTRKTIYLLITDGVANTAKYSNLPDAQKTALKLYPGNNDYRNSPYIPGGKSTGWRSVTGYNYASGGYWYNSSGTISVSTDDPSLSYSNGYYYYGGYYSGTTYYRGTATYEPGSLDRSYNWSDRRNTDGIITDGYYSYRRESYRLMLNAMDTISGELGSTGGLGKSSATVVSAFWENTAQLADYSGSAYGDGWYNMRSTVINGMSNVATGNNFATSDNISTFTENLVNTFKEANKNNMQEIEIEFAKGIEPKLEDIKLYGPDGRNIYLSPYNGSVRVEGNKLFVDMTGRLAGS